MYSTLIIFLLCARALAFGSFFDCPSAVVVFGDSYSDTGNVYALTSQTWPIVPPYYQGRYCDGPNWVDDLFILPIFSKLDYAYGSATTDNNFVQGLAKLNTVPVPGVRQQVAQYLSRSSLFAWFTLRYALHVVWVGGNDVIFKPTATAAQVVNSLNNSLTDLLKAGVQNLLVCNQPPTQYLPSVSSTPYASYFGGLAVQFNSILDTTIKGLKSAYPDVSFYVLDLHSLITKVLANSNNPPTFINNSTACWTTYNVTTVIKTCTDPTKYVFLDPIHFSSPVQEMISDAVQPLVSFNFDKTNLGPYIISY